jgi:2,3-bisphosphoglycerate-dependent phosphoglycerate mutase
MSNLRMPFIRPISDLLKGAQRDQTSKLGGPSYDKGCGNEFDICFTNAEDYTPLRCRVGAFGSQVRPDVDFRVRRRISKGGLMLKRGYCAKGFGRACQRTISWNLPRLAFCLFLFLFSSALGAGQPVAGQPVTTLRIYLARHGETDWNRERRLQGDTDIPLNSTGRQQAAKLAERLKGVHLDMVYSSTLSRSRDTAEIVRGDVPLKSLAGLNERRIGKFEGKKLDRRSDPATAQEYPKRSRDPDDELDGGESLNQFYERVRTTIEYIRSQHSSGAILIVGHAITNQMILRALFGLTLAQAITIKQANDELYLIELDAGNPPRLWKQITETNLGDL